MRKKTIKPVYQRMYETRNVRPYYTMPHLGIFGDPLKKLVGLEYKKTIYITSAEMNNAAYFEVEEMARATKHFSRIWKNRIRVRGLLAKVRAGFREAKKMEAWGWKQKWNTKTTGQLLSAAKKYNALLYKVAVTFIISQPQHVIPLEERLDKLLETYANRENILRAVTYFPGDLPWIEEEKQLKKLHKTWKLLPAKKQNGILAELVATYGWFNEIEGNKPFDKNHYQKKILAFEEQKKPKNVHTRVPSQVAQIGRLIGELGFLRLWNRYHFMHVRYHLKKILEELAKRSKHPSLAYATVEEIVDYFTGKKIDLKKISKRKLGYASCLAHHKACIRTGAAAERLKKAVKENFGKHKELHGKIANNGIAKGRVRIISFSARDYNTQVAHFKNKEILVTGMTRPQIVHLCRKAAAIVTDEGGITSHAAVISREFNIPCIIGARNATKILSTGDRVEVNANTGVIKLLT